MKLLDELSARWPYFAIAIGVLVLDQASKLLAHAYLRASSAIVLVPGLINLTYSRNRGGLFGYFGSLGEPWRTILLTLLPLIAIGLIAIFIVRTDAEHRTTRLALSMILGGAVGNLIDRLVRGEVIDFLDVYASWRGLADWLVRTFGTAHWPTFNLADSAIVVGAGLLVLDMFRSPSVAEKPASEPPATAAEGR
jgi:signal peptidase II